MTSQLRDFNLTRVGGIRKLTLPPSGIRQYFTWRDQEQESMLLYCGLLNLLKSRTKPALSSVFDWPSVCLRLWETGWCQCNDGPIPSISVRSGAWLMDRKYSQRNNNICRIYFWNIRPLSPAFLISANCNEALILIYGRVYLSVLLKPGSAFLCWRANTRTLLDYLDLW